MRNILDKAAIGMSLEALLPHRSPNMIDLVREDDEAERKLKVAQTTCKQLGSLRVSSYSATAMAMGMVSRLQPRLVAEPISSLISVTSREARIAFKNGIYFGRRTSEWTPHGASRAKNWIF